MAPKSWNKNLAHRVWKGTLNRLHLRTPGSSNQPTAVNAQPLPMNVLTTPITVQPAPVDTHQSAPVNVAAEPPLPIASNGGDPIVRAPITTTPVTKSNSQSTDASTRLSPLISPRPLQSTPPKYVSPTRQALHQVNMFLRTYIPGFALLVDFIIKPLLNLLVFLGTASLVRHYFGLVPTNNISSGSLQRSTKEEDSIFTQDSNKPPILLSNPPATISRLVDRKDTPTEAHRLSA
jgi:hypothetical protein